MKIFHDRSPASWEEDDPCLEPIVGVFGPDPWHPATVREMSCGHFTLPLVSRLTGASRRFPAPCESGRCPSCGPERARTQLERGADLFRGSRFIYLVRFDPHDTFVLHRLAQRRSTAVVSWYSWVSREGRRYGYHFTPVEIKGLNPSTGRWIPTRLALAFIRRELSVPGWWKFKPGPARQPTGDYWSPGPISERTFNLAWQFAATRAERLFGVRPSLKPAELPPGIPVSWWIAILRIEIRHARRVLGGR